MILINTKTNKAYSNVWKTKASSLMGISTRQISRWIKNNIEPLEEFNDWVLYFHEERLLQDTGFRLKKRVSHK